MEIKPTLRTHAHTLYKSVSEISSLLQAGLIVIKHIKGKTLSTANKCITVYTNRIMSSSNKTILYSSDILKYHLRSPCQLYQRIYIKLYKKQ